jgi:hypothetical protein
MIKAAPRLLRLTDADGFISREGCLFAAVMIQVAVFCYRAKE